MFHLVGRVCELEAPGLCGRRAGAAPRSIAPGGHGGHALTPAVRASAARWRPDPSHQPHAAPRRFCSRSLPARLARGALRAFGRGRRSARGCGAPRWHPAGRVSPAVARHHGLPAEAGAAAADAGPRGPTASVRSGRRNAPKPAPRHAGCWRCCAAKRHGRCGPFLASKSSAEAYATEVGGLQVCLQCMWRSQLTQLTHVSSD